MLPIIDADFTQTEKEIDAEFQESGSVMDAGFGTFQTVGVPGKSAYEIAVENGFKGSEEEWLKSLKGDPGDPGEKGEPGTSVTVTNVVTSTADGGKNVVTFSDGKTMTVCNGSKGSPGDPGSDATVTKESVEAALGYTPANNQSVEQFAEAVQEEFEAIHKRMDEIEDTGDPDGGGIDFSDDIEALQSQLSGIAAGTGTVKKYVDDAISALKIGDYAKAAALAALAERVVAIEEMTDELCSLAFKDAIGYSDLNADLKKIVDDRTTQEELAAAMGNVNSQIEAIGERMGEVALAAASFKITGTFKTNEDGSYTAALEPFNWDEMLDAYHSGRLVMCHLNDGEIYLHFMPSEIYYEDSYATFQCPGEAGYAYNLQVGADWCSLYSVVSLTTQAMDSIVESVISALPVYDGEVVDV